MLPKPIFLAFPKLGAIFFLRVVVCNIPGFWKVQKSQNFETFCFHAMQVTKNQMRQKKTILAPNANGDESPMYLHSLNPKPPSTKSSYFKIFVSL